MTLEALQTLNGELNDQGVKTDVELASELPLVMGHRVQLQEVISNLVYNAIDAMAPIKLYISLPILQRPPQESLAQ